MSKGGKRDSFASVIMENSLETGRLDSSCVWNRHLRTPTSVLSGNGLAGFLRPIWSFVLSSSLSMLGCVCSWIPFLLPAAESESLGHSGNQDLFESELLICALLFLLGLCRARRTRASWSSEMRRVSMPLTSMLSRPPSRLHETLIFSSIFAWTLQLGYSKVITLY